MSFDEGGNERGSRRRESSLRFDERGSQLFTIASHYIGVLDVEGSGVGHMTINGNLRAWSGTVCGGRLVYRNNSIGTRN